MEPITAAKVTLASQAVRRASFDLEAACRRGGEILVRAAKPRRRIAEHVLDEIAESLIEIVAKGCLEDPWRPALIIEDGLTITRRELLDRR